MYRGVLEFQEMNRGVDVYAAATESFECNVEFDTRQGHPLKRGQGDKFVSRFPS